jgi:O-antigen/teichoic acid export membrane protein
MSSKNPVLSGTIWTATSSGVLATIQILRLSILTRYIEKSDFGLVAIVILVLGFTQIFSDLGVSVSLFSRQNISKKEYSSLYWVSILLGVILYIILCLSAPLIASFYNIEEIESIIPLMGLDLIITTAGRQFRIFRQKAMQFKSLALIDITTTLLSLLIAISVAMNGGGVWSIVYSTLFASLTSTTLLIVSGLRTHPLSFHINLQEGKSFYKIGFYQTGSQILDYIASQLDILIIGKLMGTSELGIYNLIKQLVLRIYTLLNPIITRVSVPLLAKLNHAPELLRDNFLDMMKIVSFANFFIYGLMAVLSKEILLVLFGESYVSFYFILQILCLWGGVTSVMSAASSLIVVTGRTDLGFQWTIIRIVANPIFIVTGYQYGLKGIVIAQATYSLIFFSLYWKIVLNKILKLLDFNTFFLASSYCFFCSLALSILTQFTRLGLEAWKKGNLWLNCLFLTTIYVFGYLLINQSLIRKTYYSFKKNGQ